jgi:hypothetical protein
MKLATEMAPKTHPNSAIRPATAMSAARLGRRQNVSVSAGPNGRKRALAGLQVLGLAFRPGVQGVIDR